MKSETKQFLQENLDQSIEYLEKQVVQTREEVKDLKKSLQSLELVLDETREARKDLK